MSAPSKILVTEDEMVVALDLERRLRKLGYDCRSVPSGEGAIEEASTYAPDLILMDINLQGTVDGIEAAQRIRETQDIPIVYLTANADESTLQRARETQPASYLLKPFKERELQIALEMALLNHRLQRELREARNFLEERVAERTAALRESNDALREEMLRREQSEAQVREQAALLDKAQDAILVRTLKGEILYWNRSAERLYGFSAEESKGQPVSELLREDPVSAATALTATRERGEWTGELIHLHRSGAELVVESRWTLVRDAAAILIVNTDVTERKKIQAQFLRAQRLESIGALASGIAHDLNNVFTPLLVTAQMLDESELDPKIANLAEIIQASARRGADMVKQVLMFVRGSDGERLPFRIEHLAKEVQQLLRETFPKSIRIRTIVSPDLRSVIGDTTRIHQVMMNLSVNARDAMPEGGTLTFELRNADINEPSRDGFIEAKPGNYVCLSVSDTGTGMDAATQQKLFDPFFTTKAPGKGTGLGLSTVQAIVREHGGSVRVESKPGAGSRFDILLPACREESTTGETSTDDLPRGRGENILIVDDEQAVCEIIKNVLEVYGYRATSTDDGLAALTESIANGRKIDAAIVDLQMPERNGLACIRAVRAMMPGLPILLMSGSSPAELPTAELAAEGVDFLSKPFTTAQLLQSLEPLLDVSPLR